LHAQPLQHEHPEHARRHDQEPPDRDTARVEERDDHNGRDVIDDGERQQQQAQRRRYVLADEGQDADREGDIGRRGYRPAATRCRVGVDEYVEQRRNGHAADRGNDGKAGDPRVRQCAIVHFAADLESHDQEEDAHQPVVHPEVQVVRRKVFRDAEAELQMPEPLISARPGRIRPHEGDGGGCQQRDTADRLDTDEAQRPERRVSGGGWRQSLGPSVT